MVENAGGGGSGGGGGSSGGGGGSSGGGGGSSGGGGGSVMHDMAMSSSPDLAQPVACGQEGDACTTDSDCCTSQGYTCLLGLFCDNGSL